MKQTDVVVIGGGPAGYPCAVRLAQEGMKVLLIERDELGGECTNFGCIPSKTIIQIADLYRRFGEYASRNIFTSFTSRPDMQGIQSFRKEVIQKLTQGISTLLKGYGVEIFRAEARIAGRNSVEAGGEEIGCKSMVIATGTDFADLPLLPFDHERVLSVRDLLSLQYVPSSLTVVGGGYIGLEMGIAYAKLGTHVNVVEIMPQIMSGTEADIVRLVERRMSELGISVYTETELKTAEVSSNGVALQAVQKGKVLSFSSDAVLLSVGKKAVTSKLLPERAGIISDRKGFIKVDGSCRTNVPGIYAAGDVTGPPFLAHRAIAMGRVAAEAICGEHSTMEGRIIPSAIFTDPEIATAGLTLSEAAERNIDARQVRFPFAASGRAATYGGGDGFVRLVLRNSDNSIIGCQIVGRDATELISEAVVAIEMGATAEDIALIIHPHPTLPEALMQAAELADKKPTDLLVK